MEKDVDIFDVVIVEDSIPSGTLYKAQMEAEGYSVKLFQSGKAALAYLHQSPPKVLLQDVELPDINGLDIVKEITSRELPTTSIVITAHGSVNIAVDAMRCGSFDFIEKPFGKERLQITVNNAMQQHKLLDQVKTYQDEINRSSFHSFIGSSLSMQVVYRIIESAAVSKASVFITGESGTGKELCAEAIHKSSNRNQEPFIAINCAAIPRDLFESEIFGHVKGAFSGATADRKGAAELADGGTLFLDELCEMELELQAKLLRLIQTGTFRKVGGNKSESVDVRFVCATNRDPEQEVIAGRFREDLFYRLNVIPIHLPPLRDREKDVVQIGKLLLTKFSAELNKPFDSFSTDMEEILVNYDWPGNVRELQNLIENMVIMNNGKVLKPEMLPPTFSSGRVSAPGSKKNVSDATLKSPINSESNSLKIDADHDDGQMGRPIEPLWVTEKKAIELAIKKCNENIPIAAAHLGVSASTIYRKLKGWDEAEP